MIAAMLIRTHILKSHSMQRPAVHDDALHRRKCSSSKSTSRFSGVSRAVAANVVPDEALDIVGEVLIMLNASS